MQVRGMYLVLAACRFEAFFVMFGRNVTAAGHRPLIADAEESAMYEVALRLLWPDGVRHTCLLSHVCE